MCQMEVQPDPVSADTSKSVCSSTAELPASSRNSCYSFQEHSLLLCTTEHYPISMTPTESCNSSCATASFASSGDCASQLGVVNKFSECTPLFCAKLNWHKNINFNTKQESKIICQLSANSPFSAACLLSPCCLIPLYNSSTLHN